MATVDVVPEDREWQIGKDLGGSLLELYDRQLWTDVVFKFPEMEMDDGLRAHKIVLAARSPVFQAQFFGPCAEKEKTLYIEHARKNIMDLFLRYLYSDSIDLTEEITHEIVKVAHFYQVKHLVDCCGKFLTTRLTVMNACAFLDLALMYGIENLRDAACVTIDSNAEDVLESDAFKNISFDCLVHILKGNTLYIEEKTIFEMAMHWAKETCKKNGNEVPDGHILRTTLGEAAFHLRVPNLTIEEMLTCTENGFYSYGEFLEITRLIVLGKNKGVSFHNQGLRYPKVETIKISQPLSSEDASVSQFQCNFSLSLKRPCYLKGFHVSPPELCEIRGGSVVYKAVNDTLKFLTCTVDIPSINFKYTSQNLQSELLFDTPIFLNDIESEVKVHVLLDYSLLYNFGAAVSRASSTKCICLCRMSYINGIRVLKISKDNIVQGTSVKVEFKKGPCIVNAVIIETCSKRVKDNEKMS